MSTTIDQRVVEMRFDNKHFESNVATTMSTLDKLKQKLHLPGAAKGLEGVSSAAKKVDLSEIGRSAEKVGIKFNAMNTIADQALRNITNSAMAAGKKIISALTIDPVKTGFQEYETQMNAVQTILANTQSKGSTLDDVNNALENLNKYADQTIYNFTEMTRNIGTFTAAGVDLQTSVDSIKGIANLAAVSGSTSQQASTAMYQLSQALAAGRVSLMDWNSVVNAGMGGELFQNALLRTSELLKTGGQEAVKTYGSFRESLTKGQWLTTEVLTETLKQLSGSYTKAELIAQGFTQEQASEITKLAQNATEAATKVKTFSQLWDVMKESAQSGWAQTWKIIIGDFEEAKAFLSPLAEFFTGVIGKMSDARNKLLEGALGKGFGSLAKKISGITEPLKNTAETVKGTVDTLKNYSTVVDEILGGAWGNGQERWDKLTKSGYDWAHAQNLVNEKLGDGTRHATEYKEAQNGIAESQDKAAESQTKLTEADAERIVQLVEMSDAQLKNLGYTDEQIEALRELERQAEKTGIPLKDFIANLDKINGRYLLIESFKNIGKSIYKLFVSIGAAWREVFPPMTSEQLYNIIAGFHKLSTKLKMSDETADKLRRTFKGVFAILDIVLTLVGGPIKVAFKLLMKILNAADVDILSITANIGDAIVRFSEWIDKTLDFNKAFDAIVPFIKNAIQSFREWIDELKKSENIPLDIMKGIGRGLGKAIGFILESISGVANMIIEFIENLFGIELPTFEEFIEIGKNIIQGLLSGLGGGAKKVFDFIVNIGKTLLTMIKGVLGIHSPSTEFAEVGKNIVLGLFNGIKDAAGIVWDLIKSVGLKIIEIVQNLTLGDVISSIVSVGLVVGFLKIASFLKSTGEAAANIVDVVGDIDDAITRLSKAISMKIRADAVKSFATAIAILAGSIAVLTLLDTTDMLISTGAIIILMGAVAGISALIAKFGPKESIEFGKFALAMLGVSAALYLVARAMNKVADIKLDNAGVWILMGALVALSTTMVLFGKFADPTVTADMAKVSLALIGMAIAVDLIAKLIVKLKDVQLSEGEILKIAGSIAGISLILYAMIKLTNFAGPSLDRLGGTIIKMAIAIGLMAVPLATFALVLYGMSYVKNAMENAKALAMLTSVLVVALLPLTLIGAFALEAILGVLALTSLALPLEMFVLVLYSMEGIKNATENAKLLTGLMTTLTTTLVALSLVAPFALIGVAALTALTLLITGVGVLATGIGALMTKFPALKEFLDTGIPILEQLANAVGSMVGNLIDGFMTAATENLPEVGNRLSDFMTNLTPFIEGVKMVDDSLVSKIGSLAAAILALTAANIVTQVADFISQGASLAQLGSQLSAFIVNATPFILGASLINEDVVSGIKNLAAAITAITAANLLESITSWITGESSIATFGAQLGGLGTNIATFVTNLGTFNEEQVTTVKCACDALKALASAAEVLPNEGGLWAKIAGDNSLASFGGQLGALGINLKTFVTNLGTFSDDQVATVDCAGKAITALATAADKLPNEGGWAAAFCGDNSIATFASRLPNLAANLKTFVTNLGTFNDDQVKTVDCAGKAITALATAADKLPNEGGWAAVFCGDNSIAVFSSRLPGLGTNMATFVTNLGTFDSKQVKTVDCAGKAIVTLAEAADKLPNEGGWAAVFCGDNSIAVFAKRLPGLGTNIASFVSNLGTFSEEQVNTVKSACKTIKTIADLGKTDISDLGSDLDDLGKDLKKFADKLNDFCDDMSDIASKDIDSSINKVKKLISLAKDLSGANIESLKKFGESLKKIAKDGINKFVKELSGSDPVNKVKQAAKKIVNEYTKAIKAKKEDAKKAFKTVAAEGVKGAKNSTNYDKAKAAGKYLVEGLVKGINNNKSKVEAAGKSLGKAFLAAYEEAAGINSPSKEMMKEAGYTVQGFVNGIQNKLSEIHDTGTKFGDEFKKGVDESLDINSPAKEGEKDADYYSEGFINEIKSDLPTAYTAGYAYAESYKQGVDDALKPGPRNLSRFNADAWNKASEMGRENLIRDYVVNELGLDPKKYKSKSYIESLYNKPTLTKEEFDDLRKAVYEGYDVYDFDSTTKQASIFTMGPSGDIDALAKQYAKIFYKTDKPTDDQLSFAKSLLETEYGFTKTSESAGNASESVEGLIGNTEKLSDGLGDVSSSGDELSKKISDIVNSNKSLTDQIKDLKALKDAYEGNADALNRINSEIFALQKQNIDDLESVGKIGSIGELALYRDIQNDYVEGSEERKEIDKQIYSLETDMSESLAEHLKELDELHKETTQKKLDREKEFEDEVKEMQEERKAKIEELEQAYTDAYNNRVSQLKDYRGMFDEVAEAEEVNAKDLTKNLQDQITEMAEYGLDLSILENRTQNSAFVEELRAMGPAAAAEIKALSNMTDAQLSKYIGLWEKKSSLAGSIATNELSGMRTDTDKQIQDLNYEGIDNYAKAYTLKEEDLKKIDEDAKTQQDELQKNFLDRIGIFGEDANTEFETIAKQLMGTIGNKEEWDKTGEQIVDGIDAGLKNKEGSLYSTVANIASKMVSTMQSALAIHSPSRKFAEIGRYIDLGLSSGITRYSNVVYSSVSGLSDTAVNTVQSSISRIMDMVSSGVDVQPTISPVVDLSNVRSGVRSIGEIFNANTSSRVLADVGEISYRMNKRSQNGVNDDVVSAIDKLHDDIGKFGNTTYNFDGITYDDGSNIAEAVETLVRAARVERRR